MRLPILFIHGAATTAAVWDRVIAELRDEDGVDIVAVDRPCSGSLAAELDALAPLAENALVIGQSGGATLALALASSSVRLRGAICHEPAVGSLVPGMLDPVAAAYARGGVEAFGKTLYGPSWTPAFAGGDTGAVGRDLPMFRAFEPQAAAHGQGPVLVTVGTESPPIRHESGVVLRDRLGYRLGTIDGASHFAAWDAPSAFARTIAAMAIEIRRPTPSP
jgi:pimeloyl-ACP methyl ester carboxylesterase